MKFLEQKTVLKKTLDECILKLEGNKVDYQEMKKKIDEINQQEKKIKDEMDQNFQQRQKLNIIMDKQKESIQTNKKKYAASEQEFGTD